MFVAIGTCIAFGQQKPNDHIKVLTFCEVLGNISRYDNSAVAVVGRMERSVSYVDHYEFLSQDRCKHPIITHGHTFRNRIQIWTDWEEGLPKPPADTPTLNGVVVAAKLAAVRKTTELGSHQEQWDVVPNEWVVVYGRVFKTSRYDEDCGSEGCGGDDVPIMVVAQPSQVHKLKTDGTPFRADR
jgi:hypothetical protein